MEYFMTLIAALCVALSFVSASCASHQVDVQRSAQQYGNSAVQEGQLAPHLLPRKLKIQQEADVKSSADKGIMLHNKLLESSSGKKEEEEENVLKDEASLKGTWREWVESGPSQSEYFTMDYRWVRRRRPIHNKQIPFVP